MKLKVGINLKSIWRVFGAGMLGILMLASCSPSNPSVEPSAAVTLPAASTPAVEPTIAVTPTETSAPLSGLTADPQRVEFKSGDGKNLVGYYYPSRYANSAIVILMHWGGGDLCDWSEIAPWLQNRADENPAKIERCKGGDEPWWDPSWFPTMRPDTSLAVFVFDFRDFGESDGTGGTWANMKLDPLAAFEIAAELEGVDKTHIAAIGPSIGADGAPYGCLQYNQKAGSGCVGALPLSPGNYINIDYAVTIQELGPIPVWCLASRDDSLSAKTCESVSGETYRTEIYPGQNHGMELIQPALEPQAMILIQEFLELVFEEPIKE